MPSLSPPKALIAVAILAAAALLHPQPAEARRFGGGRSIAMHRSLAVESAPAAPHLSSSAPSTTHGASPAHLQPYPIVHAPLPLPAPNQASGQSKEQVEDSVDALYRRLRLEALQRKHVVRPRDDAVNRPGNAAAATVDTPLPKAAEAAQERSSRVADPRFARLTEHTSQPVRPCEIKPVMSDTDYLACGATPPQFPPAR